MKNLRELLTVTVSESKLSAEIIYNNDTIEELTEKKLTKEMIIEFLQQNQITFGIIEERIEHLINDVSLEAFPITVAKGTDKQDGEDGSVDYKIATSTEIDPSFAGDFRDVMRLPLVEQGEMVATLHSPTEGKHGRTVTNKEVKAKGGKPVYLKSGKNVVFNQENQSYYAKVSGLVNFGERSINIYSVYEVDETISMRTGNVDFNGSVIIRGDVPSGFTIKATGDIKIFGLVEAANINAGGSVYVSEGLAGLKEGSIVAGENVYINYINQGIVTAGRNIHVENSILHSECSAGHDITCHRGNIIGGSLFASFSIEAKNIGNHIHTPTQLSVGIDNNLYEEKTQLEEQQARLRDNIEKITIIREKVGSLEQVADTKTKIKLLKLTHSYHKMKEQLEEVEYSIQKMRLNYKDIHLSDIKVFGTIYPNTSLSFGKYQRRIEQNYKQIIVKVEQSDIMIRQQSNDA